ncbi:hypothetical protein SprV_0401470100 [Sparganum proliferum]
MLGFVEIDAPAGTVKPPVTTTPRRHTMDALAEQAALTWPAMRMHQTMSEKTEGNKKNMLERQDCLSCKIFGVSACLGMSAYTVYWGYRTQAKYLGPTRLIYIISCAGLASGLGYLGVSRLFT